MLGAQSGEAVRCSGWLASWFMWGKRCLAFEARPLVWLVIFHRSPLILGLHALAAILDACAATLPKTSLFYESEKHSGIPAGCNP